MKKNSRFNWLTLYIFLAVMVVLWIIEVRLSLPQSTHRLLEAGEILLCFGGLSYWLDAHSGDLLEKEERKRWEDHLRNQFRD